MFDGGTCCLVPLSCGPCPLCPNTRLTIIDTAKLTANAAAVSAKEAATPAALTPAAAPTIIDPTIFYSRTNDAPSGV